ncbi:MAG: proton-conducting transporter membrane subunit [Nannocystaceae bacterium]
MSIGVLYERRHTRLMSEFGGVAKPMPIFAAMFMIAMLGSAGVPGLVGFVGEFLIMVGTFTHGGLTLFAVPILVIVAATGVILGVVYLLHLFQKVMFGPLSNPKNAELEDLNLREVLVFLPFVGLIALMGLYPRPFTARIDPTAQAAVAQFNLKRCASIFNANGEGARMLSELGERCPDPEARIAATYGDERPATAAKDAAARAAKAAAAPAPAPAADAKVDAKADAKGAPRPDVKIDPAPRPGTVPMDPATLERRKAEAAARREAAKAGDTKAADAKAGGNP